jgi:hypothetical protein
MKSSKTKSGFGMASGVGTPWGYSPEMIAGMDRTLDLGNTHLTGQLGMTSTPITFDGNEYISPLSNLFGRTRKNIKSVISDIRYLKRV